MIRFILVCIFLLAIAAGIAGLAWVVGYLIFGLPVAFLAWLKWSFVVLFCLEYIRILLILTYPIGMLGWTLGKRSLARPELPDDGECIVDV